MQPIAIICLGNRFMPGDDLGCRVFDHLANTPLPADVALIDGGLCGLDLLYLIEGKQRVVFADAVTGMAAHDEIVVLERAGVAAYAANYGHGAGLPYLLHLLPQVCRAPLPEIALVGAESRLEASAAESTVHALAERCVALAAAGFH
ncbi:hypothetical protein MASR1M60_01430 [Rhodocyclaceae bacterium]